MREQPDARQPRSLIRRRRVVALGTFGATVAAVIVVTAATLGGGTRSNRLALASLRDHPVSVSASGHLAHPVQRAGGVAPGAPGVMLVLGGLDEAGAADRSIQRLDGVNASVVGHLPFELPGAAAAELAHVVYVFGGGVSHAILAVPPMRGSAIRPVGRLPEAVTDAAAATVGGTAFVFGGFDGSRELDGVLAWKPGGPAHRTAHLPAPLRFAAAASVDGGVIIAGGTSGGVASRGILRFDPDKHRVTLIGQLPVALAHAGAATLGGLVFVVGGRGHGTASGTRAIYAVDPASGRSAFAGVLPIGLSDAAVATVDGGILIAGGINRAGDVQSTVLDLLAPTTS